MSSKFSRRHSEVALKTEVEGGQVPPRPRSELAARKEALPCLAIDLDDTLIHASARAMAPDSFAIRFRRRTVFINVRPGAVTALEKLSKIYEIFIFTAATREYADPIIDKIAPFVPQENRFFSDSCESFSGYTVKDLNRLQRPIERTILIDDMIGSGLKQPRNVVGVEPWMGDQNDRLLQATLVPLLTGAKMGADLIDCVRQEIMNMNGMGLTICDA